MGGRRPRTIKDVAGSGAAVSRAKRELTSAIKEKNVQKTLDSAFRIASTDKAVENFAHAMRMLRPLHKQLVSAEKKPIPDKKIHNIAVKEWGRIEKERKLDVSSGFRRMVVESAEKSLRRGKKWKKK